ncbi:hypothetical protein KEM52_003438 [Ascosphaera acerosa]|nr:hypothetical protein KEM52_003438 [Ascosphaera acerosa]
MQSSTTLNVDTPRSLSLATHSKPPQLSLQDPLVSDKKESEPEPSPTHETSRLSVQESDRLGTATSFNEQLPTPRISEEAPTAPTAPSAKEPEEDAPMAFSNAAPLDLSLNLPTKLDEPSSTAADAEKYESEVAATPAAAAPAHAADPEKPKVEDQQPTSPAAPKGLPTRAVETSKEKTRPTSRAITPPKEKRKSTCFCM